MQGLEIGQRVGVPWLAGSCGACAYCREQRENLCEDAVFTGYRRDGGFAELAAADHRYCFPIPALYDDAHAAPLLCAGLIGCRALRAAGGGEPIGLYGFGAAAHLAAQLLAAEQRTFFAFTRPGDTEGRDFARSLGAAWAGGSDCEPPCRLEAAIIFAPVGALVPAALKAVKKGGTVVCAGIHMSDIPSFPYELLWGERTIRSVANLTRRDGEVFFSLAAANPLQASVRCYALEEAEAALGDLRGGRLHGAAVLLTAFGRSRAEG